MNYLDGAPVSPRVRCRRAAISVPLAFDYAARTSAAPPVMTPGEVVDYLNCSAVELSWLRERELLTPQKWISPTNYDRAEVEAFGSQWMSTREAAARLEVEPRGLWRLVETYPIEPGLVGGSICDVSLSAF